MWNMGIRCLSTATALNACLRRVTKHMIRGNNSPGLQKGTSEHKVISLPNAFNGPKWQGMHYIPILYNGTIV